MHICTLSLTLRHRETLEEHAAQLQTLTDTQSHIMRELQSLITVAHQRIGVGGIGMSEEMV